MRNALLDGQWFRARHLTSEFIFEEDLALERCTGLDFVNHHNRLCNLNGGACEDIRRRQPIYQYKRLQRECWRRLFHTGIIR